MARYISRQSGNLTDANTWSLVNSNGTSYLDSEAGNTALTTAFVRSSSFVLGADSTLDGVGVRVAGRSASPSGTVTVRLWNVTANAVVTGSTVTVNVTDLPLNAAADVFGGWVMFKWSASQVLSTTDSYAVEATTSVASQVNLYRDATANNWSRLMKVTGAALAAPTTGDDMVVVGDVTGAGIGNSYIVTMNSTVATDYGSASSNVNTPAVFVGHRGTFAYGTTAATNYILRLSGHLLIANGGTFTIGTVATPIPSDSTAVLEFDVTSLTQFGVVARGGCTWTMQHATTKTLFRYLNGDVAASATTAVLDAAGTNWVTGDELVFSGTTRTNTDAEARTPTITGGVNLSFAPLGVAHAGGGATNGADVKAYVMNLTRGIKIRSVHLTFNAYVIIQGNSLYGCNCDWDNVEFSYLGGATAGRRGVEIQALGGTFTMHGCTASKNNGQGSAAGFYFNTGSGLNYVADNCGTYLIGNAGFSNIVTAATGWSITNCVSIRTVTAGSGFSMADLGGTFTDCHSVNAVVTGFTLSDTGNFYTSAPNINNLYAAYNTSSGIAWGSMRASHFFGNFYSYRNNAHGMTFDVCRELRLNYVKAFGNGGGGIAPTNQGSGLIVINSVELQAGLVLTQSYGVRTDANALLDIRGGNIGTVQNHTGGGNINTNNGHYVTMWFRNVNFAAGSLHIDNSAMIPSAFVAFTNCTLGGVRMEGVNRRDVTVRRETTITQSGGQSLSMSPTGFTSTSTKAHSAPEGKGFLVAVASGATVTPQVYVRKTANYNGTQPRLMLRANPALGVANDTVIVTYTSGADVWTAINGTSPAASVDGVFEFYVDCDGSLGTIYIDTFTVT